MKASATLERYEWTDSYTLGFLHLPGASYPVLEPPWKDNRPNLSCIPEGRYRCVMRNSPRFGWRYWLMGTEPRSWILIHPGNIARHTLGCLLPGKRTGWIGGKRAVLNSGSAVVEIEKAFQRAPFNLDIRKIGALVRAA